MTAPAAGKPALVWFRLDLRLADNPALAAARAGKGPLIPVFIWAPEEEGAWPPGAASRWWLHRSLQSLGQGLRARGSRLILRRGPSADALRALAREAGADTIYYNRRCEPALVTRDARLAHDLAAGGLALRGFNSALLFEPWEIANGSGRPFQVFTPFARACRAKRPRFSPGPAPRRLPAPRRFPSSLPLRDLALEPAVDWAAGFRKVWQPGEVGAAAALAKFSAGGASAYSARRDRPEQPGTSRLSPHLHFGEVSPRQVWMKCAGAHDYRRQLLWREFAHHLLYHFPHAADRPLRPAFADFPWEREARAARAWRRGRTGYPLVDAGMRQLWRTGWMHNRVRMVAASFLVKDLLHSWLEGARWFWDTLVDADLANNTLGWQWVAGCGADAAPFFRIFHPAKQAEKFDPDGAYVRAWIPELDAGKSRGRKYPKPIIGHATARLRALAAYSRARRRSP